MSIRNQFLSHLGVRSWAPLALIAALSPVLSSCSDKGTKDESAAEAMTQTYEDYFSTPLLMLADFNGEAVPALAKTDRTTLSLMPNGKNGSSLVVNFPADNNQEAGVIFRPDQPWDWSEYGYFSIAVDAHSLGDRSTQLMISVRDISGNFHTRAVAILPGEDKTYYSEMKGPDFISPEGEEDKKAELNQASGLRANPPKWTTAATQFIWMWGVKDLDLSAITEIKFHLQDGLGEKKVSLDNVRLIASPPLPEDINYLSNILDEFGQNRRVDFPEKVHSVDELIVKRDAELEQLKTNSFSDRSRFGGWSKGPQFEATGFFRPQKVGDRWSLVDPEGYLYFATGIDAVRFVDTYTLTGYGFDGSYNYESSKQGTKRSSKAKKHRKVTSELRANMFSSLPEYGDELSNHYIYIAGGIHSGPLKAGEAFNFYGANIERKYGEKEPGDYLNRWADVTVDRMLNWGFTSLGNWSDPVFTDNQRIPFFGHIWTNDRRYKKVSSGNDFWWGLPDVFDPMYATVIEERIKAYAADLKDNPWLVGVFVDNEISFGRPETNESHYGIVIHTLGRDAADVPTKAEFSRLMQEKYQDINELNRAWDVEVASWADFALSFKDSDLSQAQLEDYALLMSAYGEKYFSVIGDNMKKYFPNNMYLGSRFADWGMPIEIVKAGANHVDVLSFNLYKEGVSKYKWSFLDEIDMPAIIGEFHMGATDSGSFHPGLVHAANQEERALMYKDYMHTVIDNPYFVGAHWFQYVDSPITGRAFDGENYNVGFVNVTDTPYIPMVKAAKELHHEMYERRFSEALKNTK
ncbi:agarase [Agaribacterium sp. ZY112]|uniref:agarase n=1 Tax=Agaribacterium sp. ZY112 TaxID=3233574 RepID=UPI00352680D7